MSKEARLHSQYSIAMPQMVLAHTEICRVHVKVLNDYTVGYATTNSFYQ
jgi:hypothetical protein